MERAQRRVLIQYPKRQTARGHAAGALAPADQAQHRRRDPADLRLVAAADAADGAATGPAAGRRAEGGTSDWLITISTFLQHGSPAYVALYGLGIAFFCFFYTAVQFNSEETADNLKRHGGFIPGIRPGKATETLFRLSAQPHHGRRRGLSGADLPHSGDPARLRPASPTSRLGGTSLLIVVNVTMDTVSQIQSHLIAHQYGDLIKKAKLKTTPRRR